VTIRPPSKKGKDRCEIKYAYILILRVFLNLKINVYSYGYWIPGGEVWYGVAVFAGWSVQKGEGKKGSQTCARGKRTSSPGMYL
jgi:hypothetical protein